MADKTQFNENLIARACEGKLVNVVFELSWRNSEEITMMCAGRQNKNKKF